MREYEELGCICLYKLDYVAGTEIKIMRNSTQAQGIHMSQSKYMYAT